MGRFKKGLFLGALFGAGMSLLNTTKKGNKIKKNIKETSEEIFVQVKKEIKDSGLAGKITDSKYAKIAEKKVKAYTKKNPWAKTMSNSIVKTLKAKHAKCKKNCCKTSKK
ncbi:MAG: hypothetical protein L3J07_00710 [Candidatus Magasanikbacteria bacterium]|nr:hypothetical protein [Candidatus Magasanikbacteria bacterium]